MTPSDRPAGHDSTVHPGDALSCLLDGELDSAAAQTVSDHVRSCSACAEELHWVRAARWSLRSLPPVEPPPGFLDPAVVPLVARRRPRASTGQVAASVAAGVALFTLAVTSVEPGPYGPAVDVAVGRHVASLSALSVGGLDSVDGGVDPLRSDVPTTLGLAAPRDPEDLPAPFRAPTRLDGGYRLVEALAHPEGLQLIYRDGRYALSVFESPGRLDLADLPPEGRGIDVAGVTGWRWESDEVDGRVVVFERDGLVVTVIGDEPGQAVIDAARSVPEPRPLSWHQRVGRTGVRVFEALSP